MPRTSERLKLINGLEQRYEDAKRRFLFHKAICENDDISDDGELGHLSYPDLMFYQHFLKQYDYSYLVSCVHMLIYTK